MADPYDLERFVNAQAGAFDDACAELRAGYKTSHWMWFIFPQIRGLGQSPMAKKYAISSLKEAELYMEHALLGRRLREATELVTLVEGRSVHGIFGSPDDVKFRSCLTLFLHATSENQVFRLALDKYFAGKLDPKTLELL